MENIEMVAKVAKGLGPLCEKVVFVGGSTVALYLTDPAAPKIRPTVDVDCIIKLLSRTGYNKLEEQFRELGFSHATEEDAPICRWHYKNLIVDVIPTEGEILNFKNKWYPDGYSNSEEVQLPNKQSVRIFSLAYFLASKIEAFLERGNEDFLGSSDMEDIIAVLDGANNIEDKIFEAPKKVKLYLKKQFSSFLSDDRFLESLEGNIPSISKSSGRVERIKTILQKIISAK